MSEDYNGYTNYETWAVALHIDNDQYFSDLINTQVKEICENATGNEILSVEVSARYDVSQFLKEQIQEFMGIDDMENGLALDLLNAAISQIDWYDLARHYMQEITN